MSKSRFLAYLAMLITTAIWGVAGPVIKVTLRDIDPFAFLALRFFVNAIVISPLLYLYLKRQTQSANSSTSQSGNPKQSLQPPNSSGLSDGFSLEDLSRLFLLTLLGTTSTLTLIFLGFDRTTALDATLITAASPLFIVLGGSVVCIKGVVCLREKVTRLERIGLAVALIGVGITVLQPLLEQGLFASGNLIGNLLILASNITWASFTILSKEDFKRYSPFLITATSFVFGFLTFLPLAFIKNPNFLATISHLPLSAWGGILYMSLLSSIVAYFTYTWGISKIEASEAAPFAYLQPLFAVPFAYWWLGEKPTPTFLVGAAAIVAGVTIGGYRPRVASSEQQ